MAKVQSTVNILKCMKAKQMAEFWASEAEKVHGRPDRRDNSGWSSWKGRFSAWVTGRWISRIPEGYEDEQGFHLGPAPIPTPPESPIP